MCMQGMKRICSNRQVAADNHRYRRFAEAKARIPMDLPPREYEAEIRRLARKYRI